MALGLTCALLAAGLYGVAAVLQASGARRVAWRAGLDPRILLRMLREPPAMVALALLLVGFGLHLVAVRLLPLFLAQTGIAMSLVVSAVMAIVTFGERLNRLEWCAVGAVVTGLALLSASTGRIGDDGAVWLPAALLGAVVVIAVLAWPASRTRSTFSTAVLGALSGSAYAVVGIAGRLLPGWTLDRIVGSVVTYVLILSGLVAFFLYTLALQRGAVTVATTPLIVAQTVVPSLAGLVLLGDTIRPGWSTTAALAFSLTIAAATALVRFEESGALHQHRRSGQHRENGSAVVG